MSVKVLGISTSPRKNGNSDLLLKEALRGVEEAGAFTEYVRVRDLNMSGCTSCGHCEKHGVCSQKDDFPPLMGKMLEADLLIFATPVYFMGVCAWGKMVIDRCQCLWSRKYKLKQDVRDPKRIWGGMIIAVGGTRSQKMFDSIRLTMKYFYDVLEINKMEEIFINQIDEKGAIKNHPTALQEAFSKVKELIESIKR